MLQALEALLPETADEFLNLANAHVTAGIQYRFAATQMVRIAAQCMDWTDAAGRKAAARFLRGQMLIDPR